MCGPERTVWGGENFHELCSNGRCPSGPSNVGHHETHRCFRLRSRLETARNTRSALQSDVYPGGFAASVGQSSRVEEISADDLRQSVKDMDDPGHDPWDWHI